MNLTAYRPFLFAVLLVLFWPMAFPVTKLGIRYFSPEGLLVFRFLLAALAMGAYLLWKQYPLPRRADLPRLFLSGMLGVFGFVYFINLASETLPAGEISFLVAINPLYLVLHNALTKAQPVTRRIVLGSFVSLSGVGLITLTGPELVIEIGMLYAILSGACFAANMVVQKPLFVHYPVAMVGAYLPIMAAIGALPLLIPHLHELSTETPWQGVAIIIFLALISTALGFLVWSYLIKSLTQAQASGLVYFLPFSASLSAIPILGEQMPISSWLGGALIVAGSVITHLHRRRRRTPA